VPASNQLSAIFGGLYRKAGQANHHQQNRNYIAVCTCFQTIPFIVILPCFDSGRIRRYPGWAP
jgi:hypothetical protein